MPILTMSPVAKASVAYFTLSRSTLALNSKVVASPYFSQIIHWKSISLTYNSGNGNQKKTLVFPADVAEPSAAFKLSANARDTFVIKTITIHDFDGGYLTLNRSDLVVAEFDIDLSVVAPSVPAIPINVAVSQVGTAAVFTWDAPSGTVTGYDVYRSANGGTTFTKEGDAILNTSFTDNSVSFGGGYQYYVIAKNSVGDSIQSDTVSITIYDVPAIPANVSVVQTSAGVNYFSWDAPQGPVDGYHVYASYDGGNNYTILPDTTDTFYSDSVDPSSSATFFYQVNAFNALGDGALTSPVSIMMIPEAIAPSMPSGYMEGADIRVNWTGEDNILYRIYRSFNGGAFSQVHETLNTNRSSSLGTFHTWLDNSVLASGSYVYRIFGLSWGTESEFFSDTLSVEVAAALDAPVLSSVVISNQQTSMGLYDATFTFTPVAGVGVLYNVYESYNNGVSYTKVSSMTLANSGEFLTLDFLGNTIATVKFYITAESPTNTESAPSNVITVVVEMPDEGPGV